jgi:hypothetical protein
MDQEELEGKIVIGEFVERKRATLVENVYAIMKEAQRNGK